VKVLLGRDATLHVPRGVGLPHVVALEIAEQPDWIAAEARVVAKSRPHHLACKVDRRQPLDGEHRALEDHHGLVAARAAELVELLAAALEVVREARRLRGKQRLGSRGELAVLDERLDDGSSSSARCTDIAAKGPRPELAAHAVAVRVRSIVGSADQLAGALASSTSLWMPM
jgi:hypothetical protein